MNPFLSMLGLGGPAAGGNGTGLMRQAVMAFLSGQKAEDFMANLSKTDSRFKGIDFNNLEATAHNLCKQRGVDENQLVEKVQKDISSMM